MSTLRSIVNVEDKRYLVDLSSGDVLGEVGDTGTLVYVSNKVKRKEPFVIIMQTDLEAVSKLKLRGSVLTVLLYLISVLQYENYILVNQARVATELGLTKSQVCGIFKTLLARGIISRKVNRTLAGAYILNPKIAWRGSFDSLIKASKEVNCQPEYTKGIE